jgi:hypothetical protein
MPAALAAGDTVVRTIERWSGAEIPPKPVVYEGDRSTSSHISPTAKRQSAAMAYRIIIASPGNGGVRLDPRFGRNY